MVGVQPAVVGLAESSKGAVIDFGVNLGRHNIACIGGEAYRRDAYNVVRAEQISSNLIMRFVPHYRRVPPQQSGAPIPTRAPHA